MSEHTKGPWKVVGPEERLSKTLENYYFIDAGEGFLDPRGGKNTGFGLCGFMNEADANLIARAPSMYKILKELAEIFPEDSIGELDASDFKDRAHRIWTVAKMAEIVGNKAEGKS